MEKETKRELLIKYGLWFIILITAVIFILSDIFVISETGKTVWQIIADGVVIIAIGYIITSLLDIQGILIGKRQPEVINSEKDKRIKVKQCEPYIQNMDLYCENQNNIELKKVRTKILSEVGLKYDDYFNENGDAIGFKLKEPKKINYKKLINEETGEKYLKEEIMLKNKQYRQDLREFNAKLNSYKKSLKIKITELTTQALMSDGSKSKDRFDFGKNENEYLAKSRRNDFVSKIALAVLFAYYTITPAQDYRYIEMLWKVLQVVVFLGFGFLSLLKSYFFMTKNYVARVLRQTNELNKFLREQQPLLKEDFEKEIIDKAVKTFEDKFEIAVE